MKYGASFLFAIIIHIMLALLFTFSFTSKKPRLNLQEAISVDLLDGRDLEQTAPTPTDRKKLKISPNTEPLGEVETYEQKQARELAERIRLAKIEALRLAELERQRLIEQARIVEEARIAEEARIDEEIRLADIQRQHEEERQAEEEIQRLADIQQKEIEQKQLQEKIAAVQREVVLQQQKLAFDKEKEAKRLTAEIKKKQALKDKKIKENADKKRKERAERNKKERAENRRKQKIKAKKEAKKRKAKQAAQAKERAQKQKEKSAAAKIAEANQQENAARDKEAARLAQKKNQEQARRSAEKARQQQAEKTRQEAISNQKKEQAAADLAEKRAIKRKEIKAKQQRDISGFINGIDGRITTNWTRPISMQSNLSCKVRVKLKRNGGVTSATIAQSSGDALFDKSALNAVYNSSPLPMPNDPDVYKELKAITFTFKPE